MTREEREEHLDWLYRLKSEIFVSMPTEWIIPMVSALNVAIEALNTVDAVEEIKAEILKLKGYNPENCGVHSDVFQDRLILESYVFEAIDKHISRKETDDYFRGAQQEI